MKVKIYNALVNRQPGIKERYYRCRKDTSVFFRYFSLVYLLWLNFCYYVLCMHWLGHTDKTVAYEKQRLNTSDSESGLRRKKGVCAEQFVKDLSAYDVVSFDIFDTLIFRPFSEPADLFFFLGDIFERLDFKEFRKQRETDARKRCFSEKGHYEVTLHEIWKEIERWTGIPAERGETEEIALEQKLCYANPFMLEVYHKLKCQGKKIIAVSDMYLPTAVLEKILQKNGYDGIDRIYVSCEYKKSKATGELFKVVRNDYDGSIVHVGDNKHSDVSMARKRGLSTYYYPNINESGKKYRAYDMSSLIGGAYRGIINNTLHSNTIVKSMEYEYGFVYGGLFTVGYCAFIKEYCKKNNVDKVLFLSRDGDTLKQAYDILFPGEKTEYVYWSRLVGTKLMAQEDKYDYFRRFLFHKRNQGITLEQIFKAMDIEFLSGDIPKGFCKETVLMDKNISEIQSFLEENMEQIILKYEEELLVAKEYYTEIVRGCKKIVVVDIGWAGSAAVALRHLIRNRWKMPCEIIGMIAGTNTMHNEEPNASEAFLQSGKLVAYLYSQQHNRDLLKKHNPNQNYNLYWELLLASPTPQFSGFSVNECGWEFCFGKYDVNQQGIKEIQSGILDFVKEYMERFGTFPMMYNISGRDAYAPMLLASCKRERYLKKMLTRFSPESNVG